MAKLSKDWLFEPHIELEYKSYVLMAYLQDVSMAFEVNRLYPHLADLVQHYNALHRIKAEHERLESMMPKNLRGIRPNYQLDYEKMTHPETLEEIIEIMDYAIPLLEKHVKSGQSIYEQLEQIVHVNPVGLMPLNTDEGYLLVSNGNEMQTRVFDFSITIFENPTGRYRAIHTSFVREYRRNFSNTPEQIKIDLIRNSSKLPNPVTLTVESEYVLPFEETLLPIAKRSVVKYLGREA